ncbi:scavenger receptor class F member 1-like [Haliotis cracherodii]|uniref:scavenger receptor class F member 1-like n=1 Tax=Haliotis cracherodii TaxID=6455 RepID=UPI0039EC3E02
MSWCCAVLVVLAAVVETSQYGSHCLRSSEPKPCMYCVRGWFGEDCSRNCPSCDNSGCDRNTGICVNCADGLYSESCSLKCPDHCKTRNDSQVRCERITGHCMEDCKSGWWGDKCNKRCSDNCLRSDCFFYDGSCAWGCKDGWTGSMCTDNCPEECALNKCSQRGKCTIGCKKGFYGETCENKCSDTCRNNNCYFDNIIHYTVCRDGCSDGWKAAYCNESCSTGCRKCNQHNGECSKCMVGRWGVQCEKRCSTCSNSLCDVTGECTEGCQSGYHGHMCDRVCQPDCLECRKNDSECLVYKPGKTDESIDTILEDLGDGENPNDRGDAHVLRIAIPVSVAVAFVVFIIVLIAICRWRKLHKRGHVEEQRVTETPSDSETESFVTPETQVKRKATSLEML